MAGAQSHQALAAVYLLFGKLSLEFYFPGCQQGTAEFALQIPVSAQPHLTLVLMETRERGRRCMNQYQVLDVAQTAKDKELIHMVET